MKKNLEMRKIFIMLMMAISVSTYSQTYNGDLTITNDFELQTFNYTKINGALIIKQQINAPEITSLLALSNLNSVGKLVLDGLNIQDLNGLQNLKEISTYQADSTNFFEIYPSIFIQNCTMTNLNGIGNFNENNPLVNLEILVRDNNSLIDMSGLFSSLNVLNCSLNIQNNSQLLVIGNLLNTFTIDNLNITSNINLQNISFVNNAKIDFLGIVLNPLLQLNSSIRLNDIREIYFSENDNIQNLNLYVDNAPFGKHKRIAIRGIRTLKSISGLGSIPSAPADSFLNTLLLVNNDSLNEIEKIGSDSIGIISSNAESGSPFTNGLIIQYCNNIVDLDFLSNVVEIKLGLGLYIQENLKLRNCCGIYNLLQSQRINSVNISGNPTACSNEDEILSSCRPLSVFAGRDTTKCAGKNTTLTATGATTYSWNTGATTASITVSPTTTTSYIVTGTTNGISQKDTIVINVSSLPNVFAGVDTAICNGNNILLTANGADTYAWVSGPGTSNYLVTPTTTTSYIVLGVSNLTTCSKYDTVVVTVKPKPNVAFTKVVNAAQVQLSAPNGNSSYSWNFGDATAISTTQNPTHNYTISGKYYIILNSTLNGCSALKTDSVNIVITAINNNISFVKNVNIYPNPTDNFVAIELNAKKSASFNISLISVDGKIILNKEYKNTSNIKDEIDLKNVSTGVYLLQINSENEQATYQILKK